jgi:hypothetical protein
MDGTLSSSAVLYIYSIWIYYYSFKEGKIDVQTYMKTDCTEANVYHPISLPSFLLEMIEK